MTELSAVVLCRKLAVLTCLLTGWVLVPVSRAEAPGETSRKVAPATQPSLPAQASQPLIPPPASQPFQLDRQRYMGVSQIKPGMRGIGRSVFSGTEIQEFQVEVISIFRHFAPQMDMVLIRCSGAGLEHSGVIAGMSGSPIYLPDPADGNKLKMIGALAYGWPLNKDAIAGVQPIAQMLSIPDPGTARETLQAARADGVNGNPCPVTGWNPRWGAGAGTNRPIHPLLVRLAEKGILRLPAAPAAPADSHAPRPLVTPLMVSGANASMLRLIAEGLSDLGLAPLQAGGGGPGGPATQPVKIVPGAVLAVPMLTGDVEFTAIGTVTEVQGDKVWGFGHAMFGSGKTELPLSTGMIHTVMSQLDMSFKMGSRIETVGTLFVDEQTAIVSRFGKPPRPVPMTLTVSNDAGRQTFHYNAVQHEQMTPRIAGFAVVMSVLAHRDLPPEYTIGYNLQMKFENGRTVRFADYDGSGMGAMEMMSQTTGILSLVTANDIARTKLAEFSGEITVLPRWDYAKVVTARALRTRLKPGEPLEVSLTLRPVRGEPVTRMITIPLPADLPEGVHRVFLGSGRYAAEEELSDQPALTEPRDLNAIFELIDKVCAYRSDKLYARVRLPEPGLSLPGANLPAVPPSRAALLKGGERSAVLPYNRAAVTAIDMGTTVTGSLTFEVTIDKKAPR